MNTSEEKNIIKREAAELPSAFERMEELREKLKGKKPAIFLDYDGCLSPIVKDPDKAILTDDMRAVLRQLAETCKVAVVSGRDRQNVKNLVQLDSLYFAGSHGFDITGPNGMQAEPGDAHEALIALDKAEEELNERLIDVEGALVERKRYAIAVHYRNVEDALVEIVQKAVDNVVNSHEELKKGFGKKVLELKPNIDWHKGKAVMWLMKELGLDLENTVPIYIGDDITDEDAFATLQGIGISVLVGEHDDKTAAEYGLEDVDDVKQFLSDLSNL
ncbi:trehalose-phosphatase [Pontibacter sp. 13R65]|uniref:trehalose-phosphatase n=1 Tax=Pontibacter sp. 13R65 TaxID=3127458 RepID=UPI00301D59D9